MSVLLFASCSDPVDPSPSPAVAQRAPTTTPQRVVTVRYRVDVRVPDVHDFARALKTVMGDQRGWIQAGFRVVEDPKARFVVVLAEGSVVDELCKPYETGAEYSCQNGPVVAINAERWREGVPHWTGGINSYRTMLLNHEMGHLLGQRHRDCPGQGKPAPVMQQQSGSLDGCRPNPWPLAAEITRAAKHDLKLAPAFGE